MADVTVHEGVPARLGEVAGLPVREDALFADAKGRERPRLRKAVEKRLTKLTEPLQRVLRPGETILMVARANRYMGALAQEMLGIFVYSASAVILVATTERLIALKVNGKGEWRQSIRVIAWGDLESAKVKRTRLELRFRNGKKYRYWHLRSAERKVLAKVVPAVMPEAGATSAGTEEMPHLCPDCLAPLTARVYECASCGRRFKTRVSGTLWALPCPGGGYFYTRLWGLGIRDLLSETILLAEVLATLGVVLTGKSMVDANGHVLDAAAAGSALVVWILIFCVDKLESVYMAHKMIEAFIPTGAPGGTPPVVLGSNGSGVAPSARKAG